MKIHSTNYQDTFIAVAADCPVNIGETPPAKGDAKTIAQIQFDIISKHPYQFTSDDVLFQVFAERNELTKAQYKEARQKFFSKGQPCFRASPLTKRYGWGLHSNKEGKIAIYAVESPEYDKFSNDGRLKILKAMKSSK
ncbi:MAG: DUF6157 family protein [Chryseolinea sp.]